MRALARRLARLPAQWWCGAWGHDDVTVFEVGTPAQPGRFFVRCVQCGRTTPGVALGKGPRRRFDGDPQRHAIKRARMLRRSA